MKTALFSILACLLCSCSSLVKDEDLLKVKRNVGRPVQIYITGIPGELNFTRLEKDKEATGGYSVDTTVSVSYASKGHPHFYDDLYDYYDEDGSRVTSFGSQKIMAGALQSQFIRWTGAFPKVVKDFDRLPQGNEIYINLETVRSHIVTRIPIVKAGFKLGMIENHTGGSVGVDLQKNEFCRAYIDFVANVVTSDGQKRETFSVSSDRVLYREQKDLSKALRQAYNLAAREVVYYLLDEAVPKK